jgi:hypothetical protein
MMRFTAKNQVLSFGRASPLKTNRLARAAAPPPPAPPPREHPAAAVRVVRTLHAPLWPLLHPPIKDK